MSRTRQDLARSVSELGITEDRAAQAVEAFFQRILKALENRERVSLTGFGSWEWRLRASREARNPRTGEKVLLPPRRVLVFKASPKLKKRVNLKDRSSRE